MCALVNKNKFYMFKRSILVIEAENNGKDSLSAILESEYQLYVADNVKDGFKCCLEHCNEIVTVFIDSSISRMDVRRFIRMKRDYNKTKDIPVLMIIENPNVDKERACYDAGADDFVVRPFTVDKLKRRTANAVIQYESNRLLNSLEFDALTGVYNFNAFLEHISDLLRHDDDNKYTMVVTNVDGMKLINERYGEDRGDELLCYLGHAYANLSLTGYCARMDADRFCGLFSYRSLPEEEISKLFKSIQDGAPVPSVKIRYGIYADVDKSLPVSAICDRARMALSIAERDENKSFAFYDADMLAKSKRETEMVENFDEAIAKEEFEVWYQPKVDPQTDTVNGAEALVRWRRNGVLIPPFQFIELFEKTGDIKTLDKYVFTKVCAQMKKMLAEGTALPISVNLSRQSMYKENLACEYKAIAREYGVPIDMVPIEITETATTDSKLVQRRADELDGVGFSLSMDDFGTGYSTLASLDEIRFTRLKLDKKLIDKIGVHKGEALLKHVIEFCKDIGIFIVAEGVETQEQVDFLRALECRCIQGYFYSKPLPLDEFEAFLKNKKIAK